MNDQRVVEVVEAFHRAFLAGDRDALAEVVAPGAAWIVPLDTLVSGAHTGPDGIAALRRKLDELTSGTWRPLRDDSVDIATSEWHGVIMDRFQAARGASARLARGGRSRGREGPDRPDLPLPPRPRRVRGLLVTLIEHANRVAGPAVRTIMRRRLTLLFALAAPFVLAGCGKGKY